MKTKTKQLSTPIAFIIFNRPDLTQQVFNEIKKAKPKQLFVVADGARNEKEWEICKQTREIINQINWDCEVHKNYSDKNLGCKIRVSSGIDWFFKNVEEGIILEDDCLPSQSFFWFCEELLKKYRDDTRIMHIAGNNFQFGWLRNKDYSYYFSYYGSIWGWATWRRSWKIYDVNMKYYHEIKERKYLFDIFGNQEEAFFREKNFDAIYYNKFNTWDYQWAFARLSNNGLSIVPNINLVCNMGFREDATHTKQKNDKRTNIKNFEINFPLLHPKFIVRDKISDDRYFKKFLKTKQKSLNLFAKLKLIIKKWIQK